MADVLAHLRERWIDASQAVTRPDGRHKSETVCLREESTATGFGQNVPSEGVRRQASGRDGAAIRAATASAAITGSDDAPGVLSALSHLSSWEG